MIKVKVMKNRSLVMCFLWMFFVFLDFFFFLKIFVSGFLNFFIDLFEDDLFFEFLGLILM